MSKSHAIQDAYTMFYPWFSILSNTYSPSIMTLMDVLSSIFLSFFHMSHFPWLNLIKIPCSTIFLSFSNITPFSMVKSWLIPHFSSKNIALFTRPRRRPRPSWRRSTRSVLSHLGSLQVAGYAYINVYLAYTYVCYIYIYIHTYIAYVYIYITYVGIYIYICINVHRL